MISPVSLTIKFDYQVDQIRNADDNDEVRLYTDCSEDVTNKAKNKRDKLAQNYKKRVSHFMNEMTN
jgi:hypothetical protein